MSMLLSDDLVRELTSAAIAAELDRDALLDGLPRYLVATLPKRRSKTAQIHGDICALRQIAHIEGGSIPITSWLRTGQLLAGPRLQGEIFSRALRIVDDRIATLSRTDASERAVNHAMPSYQGPDVGHVNVSSQSLAEILRIEFPEIDAPRREALDRFGHALRGGRAVLFLGARVGELCAMSSARDLIRSFNEALGANKTNFDEARAAYIKQFSEREALQKIVEVLDDWNKPLSPLHLVLPHLPLRYIITTSVDRLVEESCRQLRRPFVAMSLPQDIAYGRPDFLTLLKLRGTLDHPHTLLVSAEDVRRRGADPHFKKAFEQFIVGREVLVLLPGHDEPELLAALTAHGAENESTRWICLHDEAQVTPAYQLDSLRSIVLHCDHGNYAARAALLLGILGGLTFERIPRGIQRMDRRRNPFRRLEAYIERDAEIFFGRGETLSVVLAAIERHRVLVIFGDSGVGKTSFFQAALVPSMIKRHGPDSVVVETAMPDLDLRWPALMQQLPLNRPGLLVLDQFERFLERDGNHERRRRFLVSTLRTSLQQRPELHVLFAIRRDRLPDLHQFKAEFPGLYNDSIEIKALSSDEAAHMLTRTFAAGGYALPEKLAIELTKRATQDGEVFLPALQLHGHALFDRAESLRLGGQNSSVVVADLPALVQTDVLQSFVRDAIQVFAAGAQRSVLLRVLRRLTLHGRRQHLSEAQVMEDFPEPIAAQAVLNLLVDRRLVRFVPERNGYELVHDALVNVIETGPLAADEQFGKTDLLVYYLDEERRNRASVEQLQGLLRYSLRQGLPLSLWLDLLEITTATHRTDILLELCRDANVALAIAALAAVRSHGDLRLLVSRLEFRRFLVAMILDALYEEDDFAKGEEAARLLLQLSPNEGDIAPILDFVDPYQQVVNGDDLPEVRSLNQQDRALIRMMLPDLLRGTSNESLRRLGSAQISATDLELGPRTYANILVEIGRRRLFDVLLNRYEMLGDAGGFEMDFDPEPQLWSLALLPDDLPPTEKFDQIREGIVAAFVRHPEREFVPPLMAVMRTLARRRPVYVLEQWLSAFPRHAHDEAIWPSWRDLAGEILRNGVARELFFRRLAATYSPDEQASLWSVVLYAEPNAAFGENISNADAMERALMAGLDCAGVEQWWPIRSRRSNARKSPEVFEGTALEAWRTGLAIANRTQRSVGDRIDAIFRLRGALLERISDVMSRHGFERPQRTNIKSAAGQARMLEVLDNAYEKHLNEHIETRRQELVDSLWALSELLDEPESEPLARLRHWLNVFWVCTPTLRSPGPFWPPLGLPPAMLPALARIVDVGTSVIPRNRVLSAAFARVRHAYTAWARPDELDLRYAIAVADWLGRRAAMLAAEEGDEKRKTWLKSAALGREDRNLPVAPYGRSLFRWLFQLELESPPWWALQGNVREGSIDEEEMSWLLETVLENPEPQNLGTVIQDWIGEVVRAACDAAFGFLLEASVAEVFERVCQTQWVAVIAKVLEPEQLTALYESPQLGHRRAALRLWAETNHNGWLETAARAALEGPRTLRESACMALERWFEKRNNESSLERAAFNSLARVGDQAGSVS